MKLKVQILEKVASMLSPASKLKNVADMPLRKSLQPIQNYGTSETASLITKGHI